MKAPKMHIIPKTKLIKDEYAPITKGVDKGKREIDPRPQFSINADEFPDIKDWSVGKKYPVVIEVEMTGSRIGEYGEDKGKLTGEFKICGIASETKEKSDDEFPESMRMKS